MNNNIMINREPDFCGYRLQSARRKKRMQYEDFEKRLLALHKERQALHAQQRSLGWIELKPPVMRGYKRYFVLRDDVARSKHAAFFEGILQKINKVAYSSRKDFKVKKRKGGKKIYVVKDQQLVQPDEYHFSKMNFTDNEIQFFEVRFVKEKWMKEPQKIYVFVEPWRFVLKIRANMITKTRARDEAIERRVHEINSYLERNGLEWKLHRILSGNYKWRWNEEVKEWEKNPLKNKQLVAIIDGIAEED
ncbi:MAG: hypothetical protein LH478_00790 [Chitinophagaceae bacterium]|nr:hypothetical protein [Chitinophagaceae bacterium]